MINSDVSQLPLEILILAEAFGGCLEVFTVFTTHLICSSEIVV